MYSTLFPDGYGRSIHCSQSWAVFVRAKPSSSSSPMKGTGRGRILDERRLLLLAQTRAGYKGLLLGSR
jgi:hypothetical protein